MQAPVLGWMISRVKVPFSISIINHSIIIIITISGGGSSSSSIIIIKFSFEGNIPLGLRSPMSRSSCDIHAHTPARKGSTNILLYSSVLRYWSTKLYWAWAWVWMSQPIAVGNNYLISRTTVGSLRCVCSASEESTRPLMPNLGTGLMGT